MQDNHLEDLKTNPYSYGAAAVCGAATYYTSFIGGMLCSILVPFSSESFFSAKNETEASLFFGGFAGTALTVTVEVMMVSLPLGGLLGATIAGGAYYYQDEIMGALDSIYQDSSVTAE